MTRPQEGETHTFERTFSVREVRQFAELSGDTQPQHTETDGDGRLLVHGLLTASIPTKIGGDLEVLAHRMDVEFARPVYTGERIECTWTNESVTEREDRYAVTAAVACTNSDGDVVLRGHIDGFVAREG